MVDIEHSISVTVFNGFIKTVLSGSELLKRAGVYGEISNIKCSGAHAYFNLKDENSTVSCCSFNYKRTYLPKEGESVLVVGSIDYYTKGGRLTFIADTIEPLGKGLLAFKLEQLKLKLKNEGLFDEKYKKPVPRYPDRICVLTSKSGAVIRDIITTVRKTNDIIDICVFDVKVQGTGAAETVTRALETADKMGFDVIIIARGGGSLEDLAAFNDEKLARAVFNAKTPIISAVGHETDFSLSDFTADLRMPTPTAAGAYVAYDVKKIKENIFLCKRRMARCLSGGVEKSIYKAEFLTKSMVHHINTKLTVNHNCLDNILKALVSNAKEFIAGKFNNLDALIARLGGNNPTKLLKQGYYRVALGGKNVARIAQLSVGDKIKIYGADGIAHAAIETLEEKKHEL